jgi:SAM-dependent methyltransferase
LKAIDRDGDLGASTSQRTKQIGTWAGDFGREYTDRNSYTPAELDEFYRRSYGIMCTELNERCLAGIPRDARILEVGCNIGTQLLVLQETGFTNLNGIKIQSCALERAKLRLPLAAMTQASAFSIPYADRLFDLVFTSGVLIHISPSTCRVPWRKCIAARSMDLGIRILRSGNH